MSLYNGLYVPPSIEQLVADIQRAHNHNHPPTHPPTHPHCGNDSGRASVGAPGHCEPCAVVGHAVAHPDYGCADVHCNVNH